MNMPLRCDEYESPIGRLLLVADDVGLSEIWFESSRPPAAKMAAMNIDRGSFGAVREQLGAYFSGHLQRFDLPLNPLGTEFQLRVWMALRGIGYGETRSYSDIATAIGHPRAVRAVGAANGRNPLPIIVPCHRVIGRDGSLTGFVGGLALKRRLLALEQGA